MSEIDYQKLVEYLREENVELREQLRLLSGLPPKSPERMVIETPTKLPNWTKNVAAPVAATVGEEEDWETPQVDPRLEKRREQVQPEQFHGDSFEESETDIFTLTDADRNLFPDVESNEDESYERPGFSRRKKSKSGTVKVQEGSTKYTEREKLGTQFAKITVRERFDREENHSRPVHRTPEVSLETARQWTSENGIYNCQEFTTDIKVWGESGAQKCKDTFLTTSLSSPPERIRYVAHSHRRKGSLFS
jgi:hypothetical protein